MVFRKEWNAVYTSNPHVKNVHPELDVGFGGAMYTEQNVAQLKLAAVVEVSGFRQGRREHPNRQEAIHVSVPRQHKDNPEAGEQQLRNPP